MKKLSMAALLVFNLFVTANIFAEDDSNIQKLIIHVKVTNATADGTSVVGDSAFITLYDNNKEIETIEAIVDESGTAVFEYLLGEQHLLAWPRVRHQVMMYSAPKIHLHNSPDPIELKAEVYDVSYDNSGITVGTHQVVIRQVANDILITEFMQLKNDTDRAITSSKKDALDRPRIITIFLPRGYREFNVSKYFVAEALVMNESSFYDVMAIPPGTYDAMFSYKLPITTKEMQISKKISMSTADVLVYSQLEPGQLKGLGDPTGKMTMEDGRPAEYFTLGKKISGEQFDVTLVNLKMGSMKTMMIIIAVVFLLIAPFVLVRLFPSKSAKGNGGGKK
jgi:hypothetical protein